MGNPEIDSCYVINRNTITLRNPNWECIFCRCSAGSYKGKPICDAQSHYCTVSKLSPATPKDLRKGDYIGQKPPEPELTTKKKIFRYPVDVECEHIMNSASNVNWSDPTTEIKKGLELRNLLQPQMESSLKSWAGNMGLAMARRFFSGNSDPWIHGTGSVLAQMASKSNSYLGARTYILEQIKKSLQAHKTFDQKTGVLKLNTVDIVITEERCLYIEWPISNIIESTATGREVSATKTLAAVIGGAKGSKYFVRNLDHDPLKKGYTFDLRVEICDHFGVDESDLYSPGLCAFWMLQHAIPGVQSPFVNVVRIDEKNVSISNVLK